MTIHVYIYIYVTHRIILCAKSRSQRVYLCVCMEGERLCACIVIYYFRTYFGYRQFQKTYCVSQSNAYSIISGGLNVKKRTIHVDDNIFFILWEFPAPRLSSNRKSCDGSRITHRFVARKLQRYLTFEIDAHEESRVKACQLRSSLK